MQAKLPPHNTEAEQTVLGALLLDDSRFIEVAAIISPDDFYRQDHGTIFAAMIELHRKSKRLDFITLTSFLGDAGTLEDVGGMSYIGTLSNDTGSAAGVVLHAEIVRDRAKRREAIRICSEISVAAYGSDADELASMLSIAVDSLNKKTQAKAIKFQASVDLAIVAMQANADRRRAGGVIGVPTGIPSIDQRLGGLYGPRLIVLAARPGGGKSALINQIGLYAANRGHAGLIVSLEMGTEELAMRGMANLSGENLTKITHGYDDEGQRACDKTSTIGDVPLWFDTESLTLNAICAQISAMKVKHGIQWAAVDHIGLVETKQYSTRNDQIGAITRTLKQLAKRLNIPIIALSQMNRGTDESAKPSLRSLRDSGNVEQDADVVIFLHVDPAQKNQPVKRVEIGFEKNRNGRVGWLGEEFQFDGACQTFREIAPSAYP